MKTNGSLGISNTSIRFSRITKWLNLIKHLATKQQMTLMAFKSFFWNVLWRNIIHHFYLFIYFLSLHFSASKSSRFLIFLTNFSLVVLERFVLIKKVYIYHSFEEFCDPVSKLKTLDDWNVIVVWWNFNSVLYKTNYVTIVWK